MKKIHPRRAWRKTKEFFTDDFKWNLMKLCPSDKLYIAWFFQRTFGYKLNLDDPKTYNEKLQWMKLYYHNPLLTRLVDKIEAKRYVEEKLGDGFTFPLLGVWNKPEEIDFDKLPNAFVLKVNHNSGVGLTICKDKKNGVIFKGKGLGSNTMSLDEVRAWLQRGLEENFYWTCREWAYKNVKRRILAEDYMQDTNGEELHDYKFFCFDGEPYYVWVGTNYAPSSFDIYSLEWKPMHVAWGYDLPIEILHKPSNFEKMIEIARILSKGLPHVRIDLYNIDGRIYVGEFTFYTWAGFTPFKPMSFDVKLGAHFRIPEKCK